MPFSCVGGRHMPAGTVRLVMEPGSCHTQKYLAGLLLSSTQLHSSEEFTAPEDTVIKVKHASVRYAAQFSVLDEILGHYKLDHSFPSTARMRAIRATAIIALIFY